LISFELMILFLAPNILIFLILNSWRYVRHKKRMDRNLMVIWCSLIIIIGLYFLYYSLGITEFFWQLGFWFSANDILHIGLIIWMGYIYFTVNTLIED
jgi:peptidoglycan biosynthesis protein MviN/MurJ (putative lipid II flippase)